VDSNPSSAGFSWGQRHLTIRKNKIKKHQTTNNAVRIDFARDFSRGNTQSQKIV
jgi:hypothetical protein